MRIDFFMIFFDKKLPENKAQSYNTGPTFERAIWRPGGAGWKRRSAVCVSMLSWIYVAFAYRCINRDCIF